MTVISRISAALKQTIQPIASVRGVTPSRQERDQKKQEEQQKDSKPELKLVSSSEEGLHPETDQSEPRLQEAVASVSTSFLDLFNSLRNMGSPMNRLTGNSAYGSSVAKQKKRGKFRKGTMLDEKIE